MNTETNIGELQFDENGQPFRIINGKKIIQIEETTEDAKKKNEAINAYRASGLSHREFLRSGIKNNDQ